MAKTEAKPEFYRCAECAQFHDLHFKLPHAQRKAWTATELARRYGMQGWERIYVSDQPGVQIALETRAHQAKLSKSFSTYEVLVRRSDGLTAQVLVNLNSSKLRDNLEVARLLVALEEALAELAAKPVRIAP